MKLKELQQFSWTELILVTAVCFFAFGGLIRLINGSHFHSALFIKIGIVSLILSAVSYLTRLNTKPAEKKKTKHSAL